jgi:hypothetical protein
MTPSKWSGVAVAMQSALATAVALTGITKANPAVASWSTGTDPANGDFLSLSIDGMRQLDSRVVRAANVNGAGNTLELEGVNSTAFDTFSAGTMSVITFGTTISTFANLSSSGGDFDFLDYTTIHDLQRRQLPNLPNPLTYTFENIWDASDPGLIALKSASDNQAKRAFRLTFQNGQKVVFQGYVGCTLAPGGGSGEIVKTQVVITVDGSLMTYAT